ncbi:putative inorganic phosphate cotransporter [Episyrphus balteatus]|uniref:putative inorganic phosphate cotransporter n=1 Tax=Episyrphus balteatus TaxID=286459 RepID=UPI00248623BA|nr:putative inorganic phosphate cotransporter [Episyrphus balteatus]
MTEIAVLKKGPSFGARHVQTLLLFLAIAISFCERLNVSVSLVAMTNANSTNIEFREFDWDEKQRSYILSSFYWGYVLTQLPAGYLAQRIGVKLMMFLSVLCCSICTFIIPFCVNWGGWQIYCFIRIIQGLSQGFLFPLVHAHLATWAPTEEITRLGGLSHTGVEFGIIFAMGLSGFIAGSSLGWPGNFYVFGLIGVLFCLIWMILAENSPSRSKSINLEEKDYILRSQSKASDSQTARIPVPWRKILTSIPFLSLTFMAMCGLWGVATMQAYIPPYMHGILKMNIKKNALFSTLPFVAMLICALIFCWLADLLLMNRLVTLGVIRKGANTISMWIPAAIFLAIGYLDENQSTLALILIILNVGINAGHTVGGLLNIIDLSPNHAGVLMGILNAVCNLVPIVAPLVNGRILSDETNRSQWQIVFLITATIFFVGNLQFLFFGSTDVQIWNDEDYLKKQDTERGNKADIQKTIDDDQRERKECYVNRSYE